MDTNNEHGTALKNVGEKIITSNNCALCLQKMLFLKSILFQNFIMKNINVN